jgi:hypothetical protein
MSDPSMGLDARGLRRYVSPLRETSAFVPHEAIRGFALSPSQPWENERL